jgi:hypothetical protein
MIRRVAFKKAALAGSAGAAAWEGVVRLALLAGAPLFDLVHLLGTTLAPGAAAWQWWALGLALHAGVGAIWAVFYAYFFWSALDAPPVLQGLAFSLGPAALAGLVMVPQLGTMNPETVAGARPQPGLFASALGWGGPAGILLGHLVYGAVMGALYTRPVGHPVRAERPR